MDTSCMNDVDVAIAVAEAGVAVVRLRFGTTLQRLDKEAGDFATSADIEAEKAGVATLGSAVVPALGCSIHSAAP